MSENDVYTTRVNDVLAGQVAPLGDKGRTSAIDKRSVAGAVTVTEEGITVDQQSDRKNHGGPEKALHHYPFDHYEVWRAELASPPEILFQPGAFGENLSTLGLTEDSVCIGDIVRVGSCVLQVSQARQPCWKLNIRLDDPHMARRVQETGRTGWYYRVLEGGQLAAGDTLALLERPCPDWSLARILHTLYVDTANREALEGIAGLELMAPTWRRLAEKRLRTGQVEDWRSRLEGK